MTISRDSARQSHVPLKCNKCLGVCLPPVHLVFYPPDNQTGPLLSTSCTFCLINTPLRRPLRCSCLAWSLTRLSPFPLCLSLVFSPFSLNSFSVELVLCPFHCSLSALWFPAVYSRHQLTFSSVFRMTTNSGSSQPVSSFLSKTVQPPNLPTHAVDFINTQLQHS